MVNMDKSQFNEFAEELQLEINKFTCKHKMDTRDVYILLKYLAFIYERNIVQQIVNGAAFINVTDTWLDTEKTFGFTRN